MMMTEGRRLILKFTNEAGGQRKRGKTESSAFFFWTATAGVIAIGIAEEEGQPQAVRAERARRNRYYKL